MLKLDQSNLYMKKTARLTKTVYCCSTFIIFCVGMVVFYLCFFRTVTCTKHCFLFFFVIKKSRNIKCVKLLCNAKQMMAFVWSFIFSHNSARFWLIYSLYYVNSPVHPLEDRLLTSRCLKCRGIGLLCH